MYRYATMLLLRRRHGLRLCPTYDIDVVWHAHMTLAVEYRADTKGLLGHVYPHDDSVNDRSPDGAPSPARALFGSGWYIFLSDADRTAGWYIIQ